MHSQVNIQTELTYPTALVQVLQFPNDLPYDSSRYFNYDHPQPEAITVIIVGIEKPVVIITAIVVIVAIIGTMMITVCNNKSSNTKSNDSK